MSDENPMNQQLNVQFSQEEDESHVQVDDFLEDDTDEEEEPQDRVIVLHLFEITVEEDGTQNYGTPPASQSCVQALENVRVSKQVLGSVQLPCAVCLDEFEVGVQVKKMPCNHIFHADCLLPWLALHNSCPSCRYELPTDDLDYENKKKSETQLLDSVAADEEDAPPPPPPIPLNERVFDVWHEGGDAAVLAMDGVAETVNDFMQFMRSQQPSQTKPAGPMDDID